MSSTYTIASARRPAGHGRSRAGPAPGPGPRLVPGRDRRAAGAAGCAGADCGDIRARAEAHLAAVERKRARLEEIAEELRGVIAACPGSGGDPRACAILGAFGHPDPGRGRGHAPRGDVTA